MKKQKRNQVNAMHENRLYEWRKKNKCKALEKRTDARGSVQRCLIPVSPSILLSISSSSWTQRSPIQSPKGNTRLISSSSCSNSIRVVEVLTVPLRKPINVTSFNAEISVRCPAQNRTTKLCLLSPHNSIPPNTADSV